jgi:error-prone DNA polymerase
VDIESDRREEAIQYVYAKYGRHHAAQVANVITYRARSAVRDMAKALGYSPGQQDAWSKQIDRWGPIATTATDAAGEEHPIPADVLALAHQIGDAPRHLGIHSGGMVICDRPVSEVVPVEHARMKGRTVLLYWTTRTSREVRSLAGQTAFHGLEGAISFLGLVRPTGEGCDDP